MDKQHDLKNVPELSTKYSTFPVLFSHGHVGIIGPPKKNDSVNLDADDDDSILNLEPQLQRCDDGDAPEVQSTQPVKPFPLQKKCM